MSNESELRFVELVAARMSHDLVGPVGATVNGIELLSEGEAADPEVVRLIGHSARQSSRRLQVFRAIYGTPGALPAGAPFAAAAQLLAGMLDGEKVSMRPWRVDAVLEAAAGRAGARVALFAGFLLTEALPRGGEIGLATSLAGTTATFDWVAEGTGARLLEEVTSALAGKIPLAEISAKAVPAEMLRRLVAAAGGKIVQTPGKDRFGLTLTVSAPGDG
jgi:histidine phosphotransferase ChpT